MKFCLMLLPSQIRYGSDYARYGFQTWPGSLGAFFPYNRRLGIVDAPFLSPQPFQQVAG